MINSQVDEITAKVESEFRDMDGRELNIRPAPDKWSIAQCLDHIIVYNETFIAVFDRVLSGLYQRTFWQKKNPFTDMAARNALKALNSRKIKFKAPRVFMPSEGNVRHDIVDHFMMHQEELKQYFEKLESQGLRSEIISAPVIDAVTIKIDAVMEVILAHERRHLDQAIGVKKECFDS